MKNALQALFAFSLLTIFVLGGGSVSAQAETTNAQSVRQVAALTSSDAATYSNPSGAFEPMPSTFLDVDLTSDSLLIISFSARGSVAPSGSQIIPILFVKCEIDGLPCEPDFNAVEFLYPQFCCDTRSFTWAVHEAKKGAHNIAILWGMGNPTLAVISNRTLVVEA
jgi:hypothetical protein